MIKKCLAFLIIFAFAAGMLTGCYVAPHVVIPEEIFELGESGPEINVTPIATDVELPGFSPVAQNNGLILYVNEVSTGIAVYNESTEEFWYSNPPDAAADPYATPVIREQMQSQVRVSYLDMNNVENTITNYSSTQEFGRYSIQNIDNGIEVSYVLGNFKPPLLLPNVFTEERFLLFYDKLATEDDKDEMKRRYRKVSLDILEDPTERASMLRRFPILKEQTLYIKYEMQDYIAERLANILKDVGYTQEDFEYDSISDAEASAATKVRIAITVRYTIEDGLLKVTVPIDKLITQNQFRLYYVSVLNMFGAGSNWDKGYIFVPDGSGGLINFNNGKTSAAGYTSTLFSNDASRNDRDGSNPEMRPNLPVFGINKNGKSFFAIIEGASASARLRADISGKTGSYNFVFPEFCVRDNALSDLGNIAGDTSMRVYQQDMISEDICIAYKFLETEDSSYSGMAKYYREYLKEKGGLASNEQGEDLPMLIDLYGSVQKIKNVFGLPLQVFVPLTGYSDADVIVSEFMDSGVKNLSARYIGWYNKGVKNVNPSDIKLIRALGGKEEFNNMVKSFADKGVDLYMNTNLMYLSENTSSDGISIKNDTVHFMDRSTGFIYGKSMVDLKADRDRGRVFIISPNSISRLFDEFSDNLDALSYDGGLAFDHMNTDINSDFNLANPADRNETVTIYKSAYAAAIEKGHDLLMDGANYYGFAYADAITGVPYFSNRFRILDVSIPFIQMVISGSVEYYSAPINLGSDYSTDLLRMAETGSGLYCALTYGYDRDITKSGNDSLYSVSYKVWIEKLTESYKKLNEDLKPVIGHAISEHFILADDLTMTVYDNNMAVLVNYGDESIDIGDLQLQENSAASLVEATVIQPGTYKLMELVS